MRLTTNFDSPCVTVLAGGQSKFRMLKKYVELKNGLGSASLSIIIFTEWHLEAHHILTKACWSAVRGQRSIGRKICKECRTFYLRHHLGKHGLLQGTKIVSEKHSTQKCTKHNQARESPKWTVWIVLKPRELMQRQNMEIRRLTYCTSTCSSFKMLI